MNKDYNYLEVTINGNTANIVLDRPGKRNALNLEFIDEIVAAVRFCNDNNDVDMIVISSSVVVPPIFSAGIDLPNLGSLIMNTDPSELPAFIKELQDKFTSIAESKKVIIAVIDGLCIGSGLELALACDFRISTPSSKLGLYETKYGIIPDLGGTTRLIRLTNMQTAKRLILLSDTLSGNEAHRLGLVDWISEDPIEMVDELKRKLSETSLLAVQKAKQLIHKSIDLTTQDALNADSAAQMELLASGEPMKLIKEYLG